MAWKIVQRRLGKAGEPKQRMHRQRQWDREYGQGCWAVGFKHEGRFLTYEDALSSIYHRSYELHFRRHPEDLDELCRLAKALRNPHAEATGGVDLQVPAIHRLLKAQGLSLSGQELVDIGSWQGRASHAISIRLSPLQVRAAGHPKRSLESYWQRQKCLAVWRPHENSCNQ